MRTRVICRVEKIYFFTLSTTALFLYQKHHASTSGQLVRYSVTPRARSFYYFVAFMYAILLLLLFDWGFGIKVVHGPIGMHTRVIQVCTPRHLDKDNIMLTKKLINLHMQPSAKSNHVMQVPL